MTKSEFIKTASETGYCTKRQAEVYCKQYAKDIYTEDDYVEVYRFAQTYDYIYKGRDLGDGGHTTKRYYGDGGEEGNR